MGTNARRFLAMIIDNLIVSIPIYLFSNAIMKNTILANVITTYDKDKYKYTYSFEKGFGMQLYTISLTLAIISILMFILFYIVIPSQCDGQSIGKMVTGCRITTTDGSKLKTYQLIKRKSFELIVFVISIIVLLFMKKNYIEIFNQSYEYTKLTEAITDIRFMNEMFKWFTVLVLFTLGLSILGDLAHSEGFHDKFARTKVVMTKEAELIHKQYLEYEAKLKELKASHVKEKNQL